MTVSVAARRAPDRSVAAGMASSLRGYWDASARYQRFLYALAVAFLASAAFHTVVFVVDESPRAGPVSWRKPIEFAASFGLATASVAWILTFLPRRVRLGWALAAIWAVATLVETALITMQRWRGVASHFNFATPFDTAVFGVTGQLIIVVALVAVGLLPSGACSRSVPTRPCAGRSCSGSRPSWPGSSSASSC